MTEKKEKEKKKKDSAESIQVVGCHSVPDNTNSRDASTPKYRNSYSKMI